MTHITFNDLQKDAIIELINLGIGRAADALAQMISEEVHLSVPNVEFIDYSDLSTHLRTIDDHKPSVIMQQFNGDFSGNALLLFPESSGMSLVRAMLRDTVSDDQISDLEEEALMEIGNIILNACFGQLADLLSTRLDGEVPSYLRESVDGVLEKTSQSNKSKEITQVMLLQVDFSLSQSETKGFVVFIMDVASMEAFKVKVEAYLKKLFG